MIDLKFVALLTRFFSSLIIALGGLETVLTRCKKANIFQFFSGECCYEKVFHYEVSCWTPSVCPIKLVTT